MLFKTGGALVRPERGNLGQDQGDASQKIVRILLKYWLGLEMRLCGGCAGGAVSAGSAKSCGMTNAKGRSPILKSAPRKLLGWFAG